MRSKVKKLLFSSLLVGILAFNTIVSLAATYDAFIANFPIIISGEIWETNKPILLIDNSTYLPLRAIGEVLGVNVNWNEALHRVEIDSSSKNEVRKVEISNAKIKSHYEAVDASFPIFIDGEKWATDKPVVVIEGSTYLPLRAIGEVLGININWNAISRTVEIGGNVPSKYDYSSKFSEGMAVVKKDGKYGYINEQGEEIVECKYDDAWHFDGGFARVEKGDKLGFINVAGEEIIECKYEYVDTFSEGLVKARKDGEWGYINTNGEEVIEFKYDYAGAFNEGMATVCKNDKWGYINTNGEEVVECKYDWAGGFNEGMAVVCKNDKWGYINTNGEEVVECKYDDAEEFNEGMAAVCKNDKWGYINTNGEEVVECKYDNAEEFDEGIAEVEKKGEGFYIDKTGKKVNYMETWLVDKVKAEQIYRAIIIWATDSDYGERVLPTTPVEYNTLEGLCPAYISDKYKAKSFNNEPSKFYVLSISDGVNKKLCVYVGNVPPSQPINYNDVVVDYDGTKAGWAFIGTCNYV
ncbi:MAG: WG repeat-containing protein [Clostridia bacterium]|nr:WG repeat-containing protein [Clostridia bacterium]